MIIDSVDPVFQALGQTWRDNASPRIRETVTILAVGFFVTTWDVIHRFTRDTKFPAAINHLGMTLYVSTTEGSVSTGTPQVF